MDIPTKAQCEQAERVQLAICNEINLLAREGVGLAPLVAGLGTAIADLLTSTTGPASVAPWFARQAQLVEELQRPSH